MVLTDSSCPSADWILASISHVATTLEARHGLEARRLAQLSSCASVRCAHMQLGDFGGHVHSRDLSIGTRAWNLGQLWLASTPRRFEVSSRGNLDEQRAITWVARTAAPEPKVAHGRADASSQKSRCPGAGVAWRIISGANGRAVARTIVVGGPRSARYFGGTRWTKCTSFDSHGGMWRASLACAGSPAMASIAHDWPTVASSTCRDLRPVVDERKTRATRSRMTLTHLLSGHEQLWPTGNPLKTSQARMGANPSGEQ